MNPPGNPLNVPEDRITGLAKGSVVVLGVPFDDNSSFAKGPALAPPRIREALRSPSSNLCAESGLDLGRDTRWRDLEDLDLSGDPPAFDQIEKAVEAVLSHGLRPLSLGGDHSITYPILRAYSGKYPNLNILHLDAHPDLYDELDGNRHSHASPFARIMEEKLAGRLLQIGIRTMTTHQREQADRFRVEVVEMKEWNPGVRLDLEGPVYLSIDMDCLDPAFAPGVSHPEPGGFSTRDVLGIIQGIDGPVVGADIVEYNPRRDPVGITAMAAAKLLKEVIALMLR